MDEADPPPWPTEPADLTNCDREPIHIPGHIQAHGVLIATAHGSLRISHVSANSAASLGLPAAALLGSELDRLVGPDACAAMAAALEQAAYAPANVMHLTLAAPGAPRRQVLVHRHQDRMIVELEDAPSEPGEGAMLSRAQQIIARLRQARTVARLCEDTVREVRRLTGYDRVMVYRFDEVGHGTVVAEETAAGLPPYLDLRYPASDIPAQARRLYRLQRVRNIPDAQYQPVGLLTKDEAALDMSFCTLRGISPLHLEYLRNMGVRASFSVSILQDDRLWGMICCHHAQPRTPSPALRALCDVIGQLVSVLLQRTAETETLAARLGREGLLGTLRGNLDRARRLADGLTLQPDAVLGLVGAAGMLLRRGDDVRLIGQTPPAAAAGAMVDALLLADREQIRAVADAGLPGGVAAAHAATASGILVMPLADYPGDVLAWFRPEVPRTVRWAGDPHKPVVPEADGVRLSPRKSFAAWEELVHGRSEPWSPADLQAAAALRQAITQALLRSADARLVLLAGELSAHADRQAEACERETVLFRNSADILFILRVEEEAGTPRFRYEAVSPALARVTGWQPEDLVGRRPEDCLPPDAAADLLPSYLACLARDATTAYAADLVTPKGRRDVEGSLMPIRQPSTGRIVRLAGTMRDVTERKRLEAAEHQSQKMEAIGRLAAGVAHDFNNILQSISGTLETVQDELPPDSQAHDLAALGLRAARRGSDLTHHLLSYARKQMLSPQLVDLPRLLAEVEMLLAHTLGPDIALTVRAAPAAACVRVDPGQLQTALLNLAINASHAMPEGGRLRIESDRVIEAGRAWVTLVVADSGAGMDAATLARAMEPFFTTKGLNGTGLGLSMAQGFAEQSGGSLAITSEPGHGTTVTLRLPEPPGLAAAEAASVDAPPPEPSPLARQPSILLVDDDSDVLVSTSAFLRRAGFQVTQAASAHQALRLLGPGAAVDAMVTDYAMPGMNGGRLIAEARLLRPGLPTIVITGFTNLPETTWDDSVTMLTKPFKREALIAALRRVLQPERHGAPGQPGPTPVLPGSGW